MYGWRMEGNEDNKYAEGSEEILVGYADELLLTGFGKLLVM